MSLVNIILLLCILLIIVFLGVSYYAYYKTFYVKKNKISNKIRVNKSIFSDEELDKITNLMKNFKDDSYEKVSIKSFDGFELNAKFYEYNKNAPLQIMFHGYRSQDIRDFAGGMKLAKELKHNVLLVEQRGHGENKENTTSLGVLEKYDCLYWIKYAIDRIGNDVKIILTGVSMGAATVLMAFELKVPDNVVCVIADSPYSSPNDIISKFIKDMKMPVKLLFPFVKTGALIFGRFKLDKNGAIDAAKKIKIPVLIIHGEDDTIVPCYMSKEIYYNCSSKKELHIFEKADHCRGYLVDENKYTSIVMKFLADIV